MDVVGECENGFGFSCQEHISQNSFAFFLLSILTEQIFEDSTKDHQGGSDPHINGITHHFVI